jgi:hypothetical protein
LREDNVYQSRRGEPVSYVEDYYLVFKTDKFDEITEHLIEPFDNPDVKYLLGNDKETLYLSKIFGFDPDKVHTDYFKIIRGV